MDRLTLNPASPGELAEILDLYNGIIRTRNTAKWIEGEYPNMQYLKEQQRLGSLLAAREGDEIVAAMVVNHNCIPDYAKVPWSEELDNEEFYVIHTLGVLASRQGAGYGRETMRLLEERAKAEGIKAVRLDTLGDGKFYERIGYRRLGVFELNYAETDETDFIVFEKALGNS